MIKFYPIYILTSKNILGTKIMYIKNIKKCFKNIKNINKILKQTVLNI